MYSEKPTEKLRIIQNALKLSEYKGNVWSVGGITRSIALEKRVPLQAPVHEVDLVIEDNVEKFYHTIAPQIKNISKLEYFPSFLTGRFTANDITYEIAQTRQDCYKDNSRMPKTKPGTLAQDITRRDFTINAIYYNIKTKSITDGTRKGIEDWNSKIIRAVKNPKELFWEDPLRVIRAVRFANQYYFNYDKTTWEGMHILPDRYTLIGKPTLSRELNKILALPNSTDALNDLTSLGFEEFPLSN